MLTKEEIRLLSFPEITEEIKTIAEKNASKIYNHMVWTICITHEMVKDVNLINFFYTDHEGNVGLRYRFFFEKNAVMTQDFTKNPKGEIKESHVINMLDRKLVYYNLQCINSKKEKQLEKTLKAMLGAKKTDKYSVSRLLSEHSWRLRTFHINENKKKKKLIRDKLMSYAKPLPSSFEETVRKACSDAQRAFYNKKKGIFKCTGCNQEHKLPADAKKNNLVICPKCKRVIKYIPDGLYKYQKDEATAAYIQAMDKGRLMVRYFNIQVSFNAALEQQYKFSECIRTVIDFNNRTVNDFEWYWSGNHDDTFDWVPPRPNMYSSDGFHYGFYKGKVHKRGLIAQYRKAGVEKLLSNYEEVTEQFVKRDRGGDSVYKEIRYLEKLCKYPQLERLTKCKLWEMAYFYYRDDYYDMYRSKCDEGLIDYKETSLQKAFGVTADVYRDIVKYNLNHSQVMTVIKAHSHDEHQLRSVTEILDSLGYFADRTDEVMQFTKDEEKKMRVYIANNNTNASTYFDYINWARELEYDMKSEVVLFPKHFKEAHDDAMLKIRTKSQEKDIAKVNKLLPVLHKIFDYIDESAGYMIMAPKDGKDIINEGHKLHHCVGGYLDKVAKGKTVILFVRKLKNPDKPFVTVEVSPETHCIGQVSAFANAEAPKDVKAFLEKYKKKIAIA